MIPENLRLGCVPYLNARPLLGSARAVLDTPSALADSLRAGNLDVALVPVHEWIVRPDSIAVDGVGIACRGPVLSVFVASEAPAELLTRVRVDPASRSSHHLARVLFPSAVEFVPEPPGRLPSGDEGVLLIGDPALRFRLQHGERFRILDLGEWWLRETGLPFVFALWLMRPGLPHAREIAETLREIAAAGCADIPRIAAEQHEFPAGFAQDYLTQNVRHEIGPKEKSGLAEFARRLAHAGLIPAAPVNYVYV